MKFITASALLIFSVMSGLLPIQASASTELDLFKQAIRAKYDLKEKAFRDNDPLPIVNRFYTEDVIATGQDGAYVRGRAALLEEYKKHIQDTVRIESVHTHVNGNAGWDWANFHVTPADTAVAPYSLTILFLWERRDGEWWSPGEMFVVGELKANPE